MKAHELRIGNKVSYSGNYQFNGTFDEDFARYIFDVKDEWGLIAPIPLTDDLLKRLGFEWDDYFESYVMGAYTVEYGVGVGAVDFEHEVHMKINTDGSKEFAYEFGRKGINIKYIHELQNVIFILTGNELQITDTK